VAQVAILDQDGKLLAATGDDDARTGRFVEAVRRLLDEAEQLGLARGLPELSQLEVSTLDGSVFAVRGDGRLIVATTRPDPTVGLIFYDLKHCLGAIDDAPAAAAAAPEPEPEAAPAVDLGEGSSYETAEIPRVRRNPSA
jgi:predicted regulator of Ras-like GTPase activity (Roadblock/LC7/MglB family)